MGCLEGVFCADFKSLPMDDSFSPEQHNIALILLLATFKLALFIVGLNHGDYHTIEFSTKLGAAVAAATTTATAKTAQALEGKSLAVAAAAMPVLSMLAKESLANVMRAPLFRQEK